MHVTTYRTRILTSIAAGTAIMSAGIFCAPVSAQSAATDINADPLATQAPTPSGVSVSIVTSADSSTPSASSRPAPPPRDALYLAGGETRLDGLPADSLDSTSGTFTMRVCDYAAGHSARVWLSSPRNKTILTDRKTTFYSFGATSSQIVLTDVVSAPYHVSVVGSDQGDGKPLLARVVWVQKGSQIETAFVKKAKPATSKGAVAPDVRASRPMVYTLGRNFPVCLVQAKLSTVQVRVGLAWRHVGATESLGGIVKDYGAIAGINGSFFDAYVHSEIKPPNNELICMSEPVNQSDIGTVLGFTPDGEARMDRSPVADALHRLDPVYAPNSAPADVDQALFWQRVTEGMGAGPRLVKDGEISLDPYGEGYRSAEMLNGVALRSAVGVTSSGWLMLVNTKASMRQLAHIMKALGCSQAMNLDGGSSSGLWANSHYLRRPGRQLSNALVILKR